MRSGEPVRVGPRVIVIGGGNVAIDVALTALRQGATHVDMVSLEARREMPASPHEIENAVGEGVQLHPGWGPVSIGEDGETTFQFCEQVHDDTGKFDPKFDAARLLTLEGDHVILATGQGTDLAILDGSGGRDHPRLHPHRPEEPDDQGAGRLRRGRRRARPADGRGGHPLREDRRQRARRLAAREAHGPRHRHAGAPGRRRSPAGHGG